MIHTKNTYKEEISKIRKALCELWCRTHMEYYFQTDKILAKHNEGRYYIHSRIKKAQLEAIYEDLIMFLSENHLEITEKDDGYKIDSTTITTENINIFNMLMDELKENFNTDEITIKGGYDGYYHLKIKDMVNIVFYLVEKEYRIQFEVESGELILGATKQEIPLQKDQLEEWESILNRVA